MPDGRTPPPCLGYGLMCPEGLAVAGRSEGLHQNCILQFSCNPALLPLLCLPTPHRRHPEKVETQHGMLAHFTAFCPEISPQIERKFIENGGKTIQKSLRSVVWGGRGRPGGRFGAVGANKSEKGQR